jgi:hypothetical protein
MINNPTPPKVNGTVPVHIDISISLGYTTALYRVYRLEENLQPVKNVKTELHCSMQESVFGPNTRTYISPPAILKNLDGYLIHLSIAAVFLSWSVLYQWQYIINNSCSLLKIFMPRFHSSYF